MAWQTPKTDWACHYDSLGKYTGDYFNAEDYQRIKGNLEYLASYAQEMLHAQVTLPAIPDITYESFGCASYINALERGIDALLAAGIYDLGVPSTKTWAANTAAPLYSDLNRIEQSTVLLKRAIDVQESLHNKLPIALGKELQF